MTRSDWLCLLAVGLASSAYCVTAAAHLGPTFDEPFYVAKGLHFWRTGSHRSASGGSASIRARAYPMQILSDAVR